MKILLACFLLAFQVCAAQTEWGSFKCEKYSISYPSAWSIDTSKNMGIDLFIFSKPEASTDKFRENVNVLASNVEGLHVTLDTFVKVSLKQIESMATDYKILESKLYKTGNKEYHKIEFTAKQGVFNLHFVQYYFATPLNVYTVTLTTELDKFDLYKPDGMKMLDSFVPIL
ncbi:hypothetical protein FAM09_16745 [Niastella caeni]|uniref:DUF1795 domain-containing protein n=1 Tax=Niastella caeni TaxID=2569763 RepID=A0A4S8HS74_9BACT|nr:hypothetical protein [Niastella caeni]THU38323.1 hypothetical protein FAM09_16745 [Niastella caeni]